MIRCQHGIELHGSYQTVRNYIRRKYKNSRGENLKVSRGVDESRDESRVESRDESRVESSGEILDHVDLFLNQGHVRNLLLKNVIVFEAVGRLMVDVSIDYISHRKVMLTIDPVMEERGEMVDERVYMRWVFSRLSNSVLNSLTNSAKNSLTKTNSLTKNSKDSTNINSDMSVEMSSTTVNIYVIELGFDIIVGDELKIEMSYIDK